MRQYSQGRLDFREEGLWRGRREHPYGTHRQSQRGPDRMRDRDGRCGETGSNFQNSGSISPRGSRNERSESSGRHSPQDNWSDRPEKETPPHTEPLTLRPALPGFPLEYPFKECGEQMILRWAADVGRVGLLQRAGVPKVRGRGHSVFGGKFPPRWDLYTSYSGCVLSKGRDWTVSDELGGKLWGLLPCKVPLDLAFTAAVTGQRARVGHRPGMPTDDRHWNWWTSGLMSHLAEHYDQPMTCSLLVNLTQTPRFYNPETLSEQGIEVLQLQVLGGGVLPTAVNVWDFLQGLATAGREKPGSTVIIHCTHGVNRTGFFICLWLMFGAGLKFESAREVFNCARGHNLEKPQLEDFLARLCRARSGAPLRELCAVNCRVLDYVQVSRLTRNTSYASRPYDCAVDRVLLAFHDVIDPSAESDDKYMTLTTNERAGRERVSFRVGLICESFRKSALQLVMTFQRMAMIAGAWHESLKIVSHGEHFISLDCQWVVTKDDDRRSDWMRRCLSLLRPVARMEWREQQKTLDRPRRGMPMERSGEATKRRAKAQAMFSDERYDFGVIADMRLGTQFTRYLIVPPATSTSTSSTPSTSSTSSQSGSIPGQFCAVTERWAEEVQEQVARTQLELDVSMEELRGTPKNVEVMLTQIPLIVELCGSQSREVDEIYVSLADEIFAGRRWNSLTFVKDPSQGGLSLDTLIAAAEAFKKQKTEMGSGAGDRVNPLLVT